MPTPDQEITFGKHKGLRYSEIPLGYLQWIVKDMKEAYYEVSRNLAASEINRRKQKQRRLAPKQEAIRQRQAKEQKRRNQDAVRVSRSGNEQAPREETWTKDLLTREYLERFGPSLGGTLVDYDKNRVALEKRIEQTARYAGIDLSGMVFDPTEECPF